jgi:hypothetical protein
VEQVVVVTAVALAVQASMELPTLVVAVVQVMTVSVAEMEAAE